MPRPFLIKLFVPAGDPTGVLVASRDDWSGRAVIFPRELIGEVKGRKEFNQPGVYILTGPKKVYIGEGDPVGPRIESHTKNKDFWSRGVFFTADNGRLNKAHIQLLESQLIKIAAETGRVELDNRKGEGEPSLSEEDFAFASNFLHEIRQMLPILGFWQLSPDPEAQANSEDDPISPDSDDAIGGRRAQLYSSIPRGLEFRLSSRGADAVLQVTDGGVLVKSASIAAPDVNAMFEVNAPNYSAMRTQLIQSEVIRNHDGQLVFSQDQFFSSGSAAASTVRGAVSNAEWWKSKEGKTLGDYIRKAKEVKGQ